MRINSCFLFLIVTAWISSIANYAAEVVTLYPAKDAWFGTKYNTAGVGSSSQIRIGGWSDLYIGLWQFDVNSIPKGSLVNSAYLTLPPDPTGNAGVPNLVTSYKFWLLTTPWTENSVGRVAGYEQGAFSLTSSAGAQLNISSIVDWWSKNPNNGFAFVPQQNNNNYFYFRSREANNSDRPRLMVTYTPPLFTLKWPLQTAKATSVNSPFGSDWVTKGGDGKIKKHTGTDYPASAGTKVHAAEAGIVKFINDPHPTWKSVVVIEHTTSKGAKFCTVYWHVNQPSVVVGNKVVRGTPLSSIAVLADHNDNGVPDTHFHFGIWNGSYLADITAAGALPQTKGADVGQTKPIYPAFPSLFIDPNNPRNVLFN